MIVAHSLGREVSPSWWRAPRAPAASLRGQDEGNGMIRRLARHASLDGAADSRPHSLRVAFITGAREAGVPLEDVQDAAGHADPRTTRRYDRGRHSLDRHASYAVTAWLDGSETEDQD